MGPADDRHHAVLEVLLAAYRAAQKTGRAARETAQDAAMLGRLGLKRKDIDSWCRSGFLATLGRRGSASASRRVAVCVYLTPEGAAWAADCLLTGSNHRSSLPRWVAQTRELWLGDCIVRRFRRAASNQEAVLSAFQEAGWPTRIDNPLPRDPFNDPGKQLRDTLESLNESQSNLRFRADSNGGGVSWESLRQAEE